IIGTAAVNVLNVVFNGTALSSVEGGPVTGVETATADLLAGIDTLAYGAASTAVTVNVGAGTASGLTSIAHIENFTGAGAADQFIASVGDGTNRYDGAGGGDTYNLSGTNAGAIVTATNATSAEIGPDTLVSIENIIGSQGNDTLTLAA